MIKKRIPKQTRKRDVTSDEEDMYHSTKIIRKGITSNNIHNITATSNVTMSSTKSHVNNDNESNKLVHKYQASGTAQSLYTDTSTRQLDVDAFIDPLTPLSSLKEGDVLTSKDTADSLYTGLSTYKHYVNAAPTTVTQSNASAIRAGPLKGQGNVRITCRMDYQPDVCKDYKETGYCGYGDSCKFMHGNFILQIIIITIRSWGL
jgi:RING finger protein 113A